MGVSVAIGKIKWYKGLYGGRRTCHYLKNKLIYGYADDYPAWQIKHRLTEAELASQRAHQFEYAPLISVVTALYKTPLPFLDAMIDSVRTQTYSNWELCLSDGSGADSPIADVLRELAASDERIRVVMSDGEILNGHDANTDEPGGPFGISDNTNRALRIARGEFIAFMDHDDILSPDALFECTAAVNEHRDVDYVYSDEDKTDMKGRRFFMPHFKPDFNQALLHSTNYISHLSMVRHSLVDEIGGLNAEFDGSQDYDFILRCSEKTDRFIHIPKVLYHWRVNPDSTAGDAASKSYAFDAGKRALDAHFMRVADTEDAPFPAAEPLEVGGVSYPGMYRIRYPLIEQPKISVIIPNKDHIADLKRCLTSLIRTSTYGNVEIIVVENNSKDPKTFDFYRKAQGLDPRIRVVTFQQPGSADPSEVSFNFSAINNFGRRNADGDYLLFLNNDTRVVTDDAIGEMVAQCAQPGVGAVGAKLFYGDGTIQHAGVLLGVSGVADHAFRGFRHDDPGYFGRAVMAQDMSAVTAACMLVRTEVFDEIGGFDETFAVALNDIDLCMRIREAGWRIVFTPFAELTHYESKSRGLDTDDESRKRFEREISLFKEKWLGDAEADNKKLTDPFYNPNLTREQTNYDIQV